MRKDDILKKLRKDWCEHHYWNTRYVESREEAKEEHDEGKAKFNDDMQYQEWLITEYIEKTISYITGKDHTDTFIELCSYYYKLVEKSKAEKDYISITFIKENA